MDRTKLRRGKYDDGIFPKAYWSMWDDAWADFRDLFGEHRALGVVDPIVSIDVSKEEVTVEINLAGYEKKNLSIVAEDQVITVSGNRAGDEFSKTFLVDTTKFDIDSMTANYENGLLTVILAKIAQSGSKGKRTVPIQ